MSDRYQRFIASGLPEVRAHVPYFGDGWLRRVLASSTVSPYSPASRAGVFVPSFEIDAPLAGLRPGERLERFSAARRDGAPLTVALAALAMGMVTLHLTRQEVDRSAAPANIAEAPAE